METQRSLNLQLPRGWYQVAGLVPHTFRRHGLSTQSGKLRLSLLAPVAIEDGESALEVLHETLVQQDIAVGVPMTSGHEECAAGFMAFAAYHHVGGQHEYWVIPGNDATIFAEWEMGAKATAGMERQEIHCMLRRIYFEDKPVEDEECAEGSLDNGSSAAEAASADGAYAE